MGFETHDPVVHGFACAGMCFGVRSGKTVALSYFVVTNGSIFPQKSPMGEGGQNARGPKLPVQIHHVLADERPTVERQPTHTNLAHMEGRCFADVDAQLECGSMFQRS